MSNSRRALVLTDETRGHPFRRSLPPHVRTGDTPKRDWRLSRADWRHMLGTYCAGFVGTLIFFA
jgi:hypothetical protein